MDFTTLTRLLPEEKTKHWMNQEAHLYEKGEYMLSPGESAIYVILKGTAQIFQLHPDGKECVIDIASKGECIGLIEFISEREPQRFVRAMTPVRAVVLPKKEVKQMIKSSSEVALQLLRYTANKLEETFDILQQVAYGKVEERLLFTLKKLAIKNEDSAKTYYEIPLFLTHKDLAGMIGSTRETVTFLINKLLNEGELIQRNQTLLVKKD
ncbi:Crp/Fnr family transcriptional regulator [Pueribacillus sp. YX66]|uniref:Crp/Fnr family transcriptional regulator n=1 Tax=Pueribacillus sp. YX66 TaxID=3229242 RepID=UPI00358D1462